MVASCFPYRNLLIFAQSYSEVSRSCSEFLGVHRSNSVVASCSPLVTGTYSYLLGAAPTQDEITCFRISETWRKHATPCFRYVYVLWKRENSSLRDSVTFP